MFLDLRKTAQDQHCIRPNVFLEKISHTLSLPDGYNLTAPNPERTESLFGKVELFCIEPVVDLDDGYKLRSAFGNHCVNDGADDV